MTAYWQQQAVFPLSKSKMALVPMQLPIQCVPSFCLWCWGKVKRLWHGVDCLPPSSTRVKNKWMYTSTPPICLNGVDRDNFIINFAYILCQSHLDILYLHPISLSWDTVLSQLGESVVPWESFWFSFFSVNRITSKEFQMLHIGAHLSGKWHLNWRICTVG